MSEHNERYEDSDLYRIRHSAAHVMAQAVLEMFPEAKYTIGPPIEDGFYYDFELPRSLSPDDLVAAIFGRAPVPPGEIAGQAERPEANEDENQRSARARLRYRDRIR